MYVYYMIKLIAVLIIYRYTLRCAIGSILAAVIAFTYLLVGDRAVWWGFFF